MTEFSANLGFLWADLPLPDAIRAAGDAGFDAVECHWPYETPATDTKAALRDTGLQMLGLNTARGRPGESGLAALPGREEEACATIDQAIDYATRTNTKSVHVMAGFAQGTQADEAFLANLDYACQKAGPLGLTILIEPLNHYDARGYFLQTSRQACQIIKAVNHPALKLMFDCYHVQIMEGDLTRRLTACMPVIGHIQFASVPDRGPPDGGEVNYAHVFRHIESLGYKAPLGAEYHPTGKTELTLGWMRDGCGND